MMLNNWLVCDVRSDCLTSTSIKHLITILRGDSDSLVHFRNNIIVHAPVALRCGSEGSRLLVGDQDVQYIPYHLGGKSFLPRYVESWGNDVDIPICLHD